MNKSSLFRPLALLLTVLACAGGVSAEEPVAAAPPDKETPFDWVYPATSPLRVHLVRGLWSREYRLEEALALAGAGFVAESWHAQGMGFGFVGGWDPGAGGSVPEFPGTAEALLANHVLILCNVNARAFTPGQQKLLGDFVQHGGAILLLGGRFAFGSQWNGTPLAELAPVTFVGKGLDLKNEPEGLKLAAGPDALKDWPSELGWNAAPRVFWYHDLTPKPGTQVVLNAEGRPLLVTGSYGNGRVALFAGSVMGDPPAGTLPLWDWDGWPRLLAATVKWLTAGRPQQNHTLDPNLLAKVDQTFAILQKTTDGRELAKQTPALEALLVRLASLTWDTPAALALLKPMPALEVKISPETASLVGRRAAACVEDAGSTLASQFLVTSTLGNAMIALHLMGKSRDADAVPNLIRFLESGELTDPAAANVDDLAELLTEPTSPAAVDLPESTAPSVLALPDQKKEQGDTAFWLRRAALAGLAAQGNPDARPALKKLIAAMEPGGRFNKKLAWDPNPETESYLVTRDTQLYQLALLAALAGGDAGAAEPLADALIGNVYVAARARSGWNGPKLNGGLEGDLGFLLAWKHEMLGLVARCPTERLAPLAAPLAAIDDLRVAPIVMAAYGGRERSPAIKAALRKSRIRAVACLGEE